MSDDIDAFESHLDLIDKYARLGEGPIELTQIDDQLDKQFHQNSRPLTLDYDDFLIHSKILLDFIALLTRRILNDKSLSPYGFNRQREFLLKSDNIPYSPDEKYAAYMREETWWFRTLLKEYRDNFVVHNRRYIPYGIVSGPRTVPRMNRTVRVKDDVGRTTSRKRLVALRQKYLESIPGLDQVPDNVYEILDFFDSNSGYIKEEDSRILGDVRYFFGAKLPDPTVLLTNLKVFVSYYANHFFDE